MVNRIKQDGIVDGYYDPNTKKLIDLEIPFAYYKGQKILNDITKKYLKNFDSGTEIDFRVLIVETLEGVHKIGYYSSVKQIF